MTPLAEWLQAEMQARGWTQIQTSVYTGVSQGTISQILQKNHIPRIESLLRLADSLGAERVEVLRLAGYLERADELPGAPVAMAEEDRETREMIETFRRLPEDWRPEAIAAVQMLVRLARRVGEVITDQPEPLSAQEEKEYGSSS